MPAGFTAPGVVFLGSIDANTRDYLHQVLPKLRASGYTRLVEPCAGSLAISMIARNLGWPTSQIEASDVTMFSAICGAVVNGDETLDHLGVTVDDEPVALPDAPVEVQGAHLLWLQLVLRHERKKHIDYWRLIVEDLYADREQHVKHLAKQLKAFGEKLHGAKYVSMDLFDHMDAVADDPHTVVAISPPTYAAGYEKFFDTGGRLKWAEPNYSIYDPDGGDEKLYARYKDARMLLLQYQECIARDTVSGKPVFGQVMTANKNNYINANRTDEVLALTGGRPQTARRRLGTLEPFPAKPLPADHEITARSTIEVVPVKSQVSDYYRQLWTHRLMAQPGSMNVMVLIDGYAAGVIGWSVDTLAHPLPGEGGGKWDQNALLRYGSAAYHETLRLGRLMTMIALHRPTLLKVADKRSEFYAHAAVGLITANMTRHPESKDMRGLMKLGSKQKHPDGYKLIYQAPWLPDGTTLQDVLADFLVKEARWRKNTTKNQAKEPTT